MIITDDLFSLIPSAVSTVDIDSNCEMSVDQSCHLLVGSHDL